MKLHLRDFNVYVSFIEIIYINIIASVFSSRFNLVQGPKMKFPSSYGYFQFLIYLTAFVLPSYGQYWTYIPGLNYLFKDYELCNDEWIPGNLSDFKLNFRTYVFAQPLLEQVIVPAVTGHLNGRTKKALTLSFHGWAGGGKNYVTQFLVKAIYKLGMKSSFVKYYNSRTDFTDDSNIRRYQAQLRDEIKEYLSRCERSFFIFDEMDMMPEKVIDAIHPYLDYHEIVNGVDPRKATFVFLSNTGGNEISQIVLDHWKKGYQRDDLKIGMFQDAIRQAAFNELGGHRHSDNINSHLITYFIPFLPMERSHVMQCIEGQFALNNIFQSRKAIIDEVLSQISFTSKQSVSAGIFALSGCKNVDTLVSSVAENEHIIRSQHRNSEL
ncbi:hypothetical protein B566_EDAN005129 [Ephemera danica]|nr:hypothetical protein B566_EDAN005129 [Ephemera danica]